MNSKKVKVIVCVAAISVSAFMIALTYYSEVVTKQRVYYVADSILGSLDPNQIMGDDNSVFTVTDHDPNNFSINWKKSEIHQNETVRLDTLGGGIPRIMGSCWSGKGDRRCEYPVIVDTGFAGNVMVTDSIVEDARLGYYTTLVDDGALSLCHLCQLKIGGITFVHPVCRVRNGHYKTQDFREDALVQHEILLGLGILKSFKYVLCDMPAGKIEFSVQDSFSASEPDLWRSFPMAVETLKNNNDILFVTISIAGKNREVQFDTGAETGMHLRRSYWEEFSRGLDCKGPKSIRLRKVHGLMEAEYYIVRDMEFGGEVVSSANVIVEPDEDVTFDHSEILLGMEFFRGCVLVLDFENGLLWVNSISKL